MGRYSMPTAYSERARAALRAATALLTLCMGMPALSAAPAPATAQAFLEHLLPLANVTDPAALQRQYDDVFGADFSAQTRVYVSTIVPVSAANEVVRFIRFGDDTRPLAVGGQCVALAALGQQLRADGWDGGRAVGAAASAQPAVYRKGRTQVTVRAQPGRATCAQSILITYRTPK
jgi:hypothetical protein